MTDESRHLKPLQDLPRSTPAPGDPTFDPRSITRPEPVLMNYYLMMAAITVLGFPFVAAYSWCRYHSLRYRFDDEGVSMSWGILFHREIHLTYRRMQDIHVTRNLFHRWLGLAAISIQTASGSASAEMTIEGIPQAEPLRDFLYARMRGARDDDAPTDAGPPGTPDSDKVLTLLTKIRDELHRLHPHGQPSSIGGAPADTIPPSGDDS